MDLSISFHRSPLNKGISVIIVSFAFAFKKTSGTSRTLGNSKESYPKCMDCGEKPDIVRRKRKSVIEKDLAKKTK